jgi:hypothetical protein
MAALTPSTLQRCRLRCPSRVDGPAPPVHPECPCVQPPQLWRVHRACRLEAVGASGPAPQPPSRSYGRETAISGNKL